LINFRPNVVSKTEWFKVILTFFTTLSKKTPLELEIEKTGSEDAVMYVEVGYGGQ